MKTEGLDPQSVNPCQFAGLHIKAKKVKETPAGPTAKPEAPEPSPEPPEPGTDSSNEPQESKGVIRLLQQGHFKGVADVRLRINFFDELAAIEADKVQAVTQQKLAGILESVGAVVESFLADTELTEEQTTSVLQLQETFVQSAKQPGDDPVTNLSNAFEAFVESLRNLFAPPIETQQDNVPTDDIAGEETATVTPTEEPPAEVPEPPAAPQPSTAFEKFIESLYSAFTAAKDDLVNTLSATKVLPELSEPTGNGKAYDKFLAIYNELRGIEQQDSSELA